MSYVNTLNRRHWLLFATGVALIDQLTKYMSVYFLNPQESLSVFPGLRLVLRHNTGAAFSLLSEASGWQRWFFVGFAVVAGVAIYHWLEKVKDWRYALALSCVLGGALGNVVDRVFDGAVVDFIVLYYQSWEWPAFNVADMAISFGVTLMLPFIYRRG